MRTFLLDVANRAFGVIDVKNELDAFYEKLNCTCIDIVVRKVNGKEFDIMCDDEGLLKDGVRISALSENPPKPQLVGNLMFFHHNDKGELTEISLDEAVWLANNIGVIEDANTSYPTLVGVE